MKTIPLTQGKVALVDDQDYPSLAGYRWCAVNWEKPGRPPRWYAAGRRRGDKRLTAMHRLIARAPVGLKVDHWNGDGLDNRRGNLRIASQAQNWANSVRRKQSGFKGVFCEQGFQRFRAHISGGGNRGSKSLGCFKTPEAAALAYDAAAREKWGEFCCVNFPRPGERSAITGDIMPPAELQSA